MNIITALRANATFSFISGLCFIVFRNMLGEIMNYENELLYGMLGIGLILFAIFLGVISSRIPKKSVVRSIVIMDIGWVIGSVLLVLIPTSISLAGNLLIIILALIVLILAFSQHIAAKLIR